MKERLRFAVLGARAACPDLSGSRPPGSMLADGPARRSVRFAVLWAGLFLGVAAWVSVGDGLAQSPPSRDPQAVALLNQALSAISGGTSLNDVTLTGTAAWTAGSDLETGTFTLKALGSARGRVDLALSGGTRSEIARRASRRAPGSVPMACGTRWRSTTPGFPPRGFSLLWLSRVS